MILLRDGDYVARSGKADVDKVLSDMRQAILSKQVKYIDRDKNLRTLALLGRTWADIESELLRLSYSHYISGPDVDRDCPQSDKFWKFKMWVDQELIYIKFKVRYQTDGYAVFVSFHVDGW